MHPDTTPAPTDHGDRVSSYGDGETQRECAAELAAKLRARLLAAATARQLAAGRPLAEAIDAARRPLPNTDYGAADRVRAGAVVAWLDDFGALDGVGEADRAADELADIGYGVAFDATEHEDGSQRLYQVRIHLAGGGPAADIEIPAAGDRGGDGHTRTRPVEVQWDRAVIAWAEPFGPTVPVDLAAETCDLLNAELDTGLTNYGAEQATWNATDCDDGCDRCAPLNDDDAGIIVGPATEWPPSTERDDGPAGCPACGVAA